MSGYKHATITISQEEYRRLQDNEMKKRFKDFTRNKSEDIERDAEILNLIRQIEERERQLECALSSSGESTNQRNDEVLQELLELNSIHYQNLATSLRDSNLGVQDYISSVSEEFSAEMQRDRDEYNQNLQVIIMRQDDYQHKEFAKKEIAELWLNRCFVLADFIQNQFDHERFTPGRLNRILRNLGLSESNLVEGLVESSIQGSQELYLELSDLHFELEQLLVQWHTEFNITYASIQDVIHDIKSNSDVHAFGLQGEELSERVDLNYWSSGRYLQLLDQCRQLSGYMIQDQNLLSFEDINRLYSQIVPVIRESFEDIVYGARFKALNSQLRMNIAEKALEALENHGFSLDTAGYTENDMRSQFNARLKSADGSEVTIHVLPSENSVQELSNDLVVITSHPYLKTEHEDRMQFEEMSKTLSQYNLKVNRADIPAETLPERTDHNARTNQVEQKYSQIER